MKSLKLSTPQRNSNPAVSFDPNIEQIRGFIKGLPLANTGECCQRIVQLLHKLNRAPLNVQVRVQIMDMILPLLEDITSSLHTSYINAPLPLTDKRAQVAQLIRNLWLEMSYGYKIVVNELHEDQIATGGGSAYLSQAIYYALSFLSRLIVDGYALYTPEPKHIWQEVNQLYLHAEQNQLHQITLNSVASAKEPNPATIANSYKRIILLSLANPYHLMQGEAIKLFQLLKDWCHHCEIIALGGAALPEGRLFIDLEMDAPPMYAPKTNTKIRPKEGRLLEIKSLIGSLENEIRRLTIEAKNTTRQSSLAQRMERDMYFRWIESWGVRRERMSHRKPKQAPAQLLCGLTAAHHFISDKEPFFPEQLELRLRGRQADAPSAKSSLELTPETHKPWETDDQSLRLKTGINQPRTSKFNTTDQTDTKDMWIKVYATSEQTVQDFTNLNQEEFDVHGCELRNVNQGGFGLFCPSSSNFPARVGELIGAKTDDNSKEWAIGVVRWMKIQETPGIELGVRIIAKDALSVATKAVMGIGRGGEYYRSLIVPGLDPGQHPTTLIVPSAVYDIGSVLLLTMNHKLLHIRLIRQLESTSAFSQYQFEIVEAPSDDHQRSDLQDTRRDSKLFR
ncbi:MAG: hypothetical protein HY272_13295 [Gammaproteobacteria bacterium]|nr:hypothetical protein [Gammaproteobacteria bacterium]